MYLWALFVNSLVAELSMYIREEREGTEGGIEESKGGGGVTEVILSPQVLEVCWTHALSNEKEVSNLLIKQLTIK